MITLITGAPGAGKTAMLVDLLRTEYQDRTIFADGVAGLQLDHVALDVTKWVKDVPDGAVVVVDEVQRRWRPRGAGAKVPDEVAALETHRHRGIDFILVTQAPRLLDANVRRLVGRHLHIRDTGYLGRWVYEWPEVSDDLAWRACQNKRRYTLPKKAFDLYKSASLHLKPKRKIPILMKLLPLAVVLLAGLGWYVSSKLGDLKGTVASVAVQADPPVTASSAPPGAISDTLTAPPGRVASKRVIDDRVDWIPRLAQFPESAPAFDDVRVVRVFPVVAGGVCMRQRCTCYTQQGTVIAMSDYDCRELVKVARFNPYAEKVSSTDNSGGEPRSGGAKPSGG